MSNLNLDEIRSTQNEPVMHAGTKGFLWVPSVGMRLSPEILLLELYREVFFPGRGKEQVKARELDPDLRGGDLELVYNKGERAVLSALRGRRKQTKNAREAPFYAPAYPPLSRHAWLAKNRERVVAQLLFSGAFRQYFWPCGGETEVNRNRHQENIQTMVNALSGTRPDEILVKALASVGVADESREKAYETLRALTGPSREDVIQLEVQERVTSPDELANRMTVDFLSICRLEPKVPRLLWVRILMTYLRFALPAWLLAQMRITCLVHRWFVDAIDGQGIPAERNLLDHLARRNRRLLFPTLTPTIEVYTRIHEYIRCRVELNLLLHCLEQLSPRDFQDKKITTLKRGEGLLTLAEALEKSRTLAGALRADPAYGNAPDTGTFLSRVAEKYPAWRDPRNKGQGKNIDEFLRVLYRAERGDEAGGHLLSREGRGDKAGFRVFPGQFLLQVVTFLAYYAKQDTGTGTVAEGGKLVLQDIEEHFALYGIDFSLAAEARPLLINELQGLGLLNGSPDAGSSVAVSCPF